MVYLSFSINPYLFFTTSHLHFRIGIGSGVALHVGIISITHIRTLSVQFLTVDNLCTNLIGKQLSVLQNTRQPSIFLCKFYYEYEEKRQIPEIKSFINED